MVDPPLKFYSPQKITTWRRRCLPHLEQRGICCFVTMMTADAFPKAAVKKRKERHRLWCRNHGLPDNATQEEIYNRLTEQQRRRFVRAMSSAYQKTLDKGSGDCLLQHPEAARIVESSFLYHHENTCRIFDRVVMPNHVHVLIQPNPDVTLKEILQSIRRFTATRINKLTERSGRFWSHEPFDHMVRSQRYFERYQTYIRLNPTRAHLKDGQYLLVTTNPSL